MVNVNVDSSDMISCQSAMVELILSRTYDCRSEWSHCVSGRISDIGVAYLLGYCSVICNLGLP